MSSEAPSDLSEIERLRAQMQTMADAAEADRVARLEAEARADAANARAEAERAAREAADARANAAEARADDERIAHADTIEKLAECKEEIRVWKLQVQKLQLRIDRLLRKQFGQSSERFNEELQGLLFSSEDLEIGIAYNQAVLDAAAEAAAKAAGIEGSRKPRSDKDKPRRKPIPDDLPTHDVYYPAPGGGVCLDCGSATSPLEPVISGTVEVIPRQLIHVRHIREKRVCTCNDCKRFDVAPAPPRVIEGSYAGASLLAHVAISKFVDHLPLYRQSEIFARSGFDYSRQAMADQLGKVAFHIQPLVDRIEHYTLASPKIHGDDTTLKVIGQGTGKAKTGRLWTVRRDNRSWSPGDPPSVFFRYSPDRKSEHPLEHLRGYSGYLQADAYAGYNKLYDPERKPGPIIAVGCWAHARRELEAIVKSDPKSIAMLGVRMIRQLYKIEDQARGQSLDVRRALREEARPLVAQFFDWVDATLALVSAQSTLGKALGYFVNQRKTLLRYLDDARLEIDNNLAENSIRPIAIGRKNFLFAGADIGGVRAAAIYTVVQTCKLNGVNPEEYLTDYLRKVAEGFPASRIDELLPWNWKRGSGYRYEAGLPHDGPSIFEPRSELHQFMGAELQLPVHGVREGIATVSIGDVGIRVRTDLDVPTLLYPADVEVQLPGADEWVRAGSIRAGADGKLVCELRLYASEPIRFHLIREADGRYTSRKSRGDLLTAASA